MLRNWDAKGPKEVDIIVNKPTLKKLKENFKVFKFYDTYHLFSPEGGRIVDVHLHVDRLSWNYIPYLKWDGRCRSLRKVRVPEEPWYIAELLLHGIVESKGFKTEYLRDVEKFRDWSAVETLISKNLGRKTAEKIVGLARTKKYSQLVKLRWNVVTAAAIRNPLSIPLALWTVMDKKLFSKFRPRRGPIFVFLGPDGAGKTTLAKRTEEFIKGLGLKATICRMGIHHERTWPLRRIVDARRGRKLKAPSILKNTIRSLDMWIRYFACEVKRLKGFVVISDRYFYDLAFYSPDLFGKFFARISPRPSKAFLVYADPKTLVKRKAEQSIKELESQLKYMMDMAEGLGLIIIKNEKIDASMKTVKEKLIDDEGLLKLFVPRP
ncbi:hypothetical protein E2P64_00655 [Candidatus Bathyarchaeota archaeon]|nr:hypothetical protein E2P64_00655 [Candidatus Bathyarchaeota archaeon]